MHFLCRQAQFMQGYWLNTLVQPPERLVFLQELRHFLSFFET